MKLIRNKHTSWQNAVSLIITVAGVYNYHLNLKLVKGTNTLRAGNLHWISWWWCCHGNNAMSVYAWPSSLILKRKMHHKAERKGRRPLRSLWTRTHPVKKGYHTVTCPLLLRSIDHAESSGRLQTPSPKPTKNLEHPYSILLNAAFWWMSPASEYNGFGSLFGMRLNLCVVPTA